MSLNGGTHLYQIVEDAGMQSLGEGVPRETRLLHIQGHVYGLRLSSPFSIHLTAGQLLFQSLLSDAQQESREGQDCREERRTENEKC